MSASRKRGSRRRLRQIRFRDNWSAEMSFLFGVVLLLILLMFWFAAR
jgi:hypothetical protein